MASPGLFLLTIVLGLLFIFLGHIKLSPQLFPEHHERIRNEFGKFNKEFPLHRQTGWRPYAKNYRMAVGIAEVLCGSLLLLSLAQSLANIILLIIMTNAIITFQKLNYSIEYTGVSIFISLLLVLRLILASSGSKPKQSVQAKAEKKVK
ncbi:unnamed protein product [Rotaria socialis]|uniref:Transmembrane protein 35A n=1 Tax=Rotaria socialis TaxID=392032 RepID=A0A820DIM2_9BILA|nr:unnamed protein product [Rotaria socialis]CAF4232826.1 unnamed protein product [Rotaria socialis]